MGFLYGRQFDLLSLVYQGTYFGCSCKKEKKEGKFREQKRIYIS